MTTSPEFLENLSDCVICDQPLTLGKVKCEEVKLYLEITSCVIYMTSSLLTIGHRGNVSVYCVLLMFAKQLGITVSD